MVNSHVERTGKKKIAYKIKLVDNIKMDPKEIAF
jgi:hypothetical protein